MNPPLITKKALVYSLLLSLFVIFIIIIPTVFDNRTKIVFCDVGQGDAAYIRIKNKFDLLIDAGPNKRILDCLGKHMPFWDRKIEISILSHPNKDHYGGLFFILDRYQVSRFITINYQNTSKTYQELIKKVKEKNILYQFMTNGNKIKILGDVVVFYWPPINSRFLSDNNSSLIFLFQEKQFKVLFTADTSASILNFLPKQEISHVSILKIPHHGSKTGLNKTFLKLADPGLSVISVGKNNSYGHPHKEVIDSLEALNVKYWRTDEKGDLVIYVPN